MIFVRETSAAVVLVTLTLSLQCAGLAALIGWARPSFAPHVHRIGPLRSAMLMVRFMTAFIVLHVFELMGLTRVTSEDGKRIAARLGNAVWGILDAIGVRRDKPA